MSRIGTDCIRFLETGEVVKVKYHSAKLFEVLEVTSKDPVQESPHSGILKADKAFQLLLSFLQDYDLVETIPSQKKEGIQGRSFGPVEGAKLPFLDGFCKFVEDEWQSQLSSKSADSFQFKWPEGTEVFSFRAMEYEDRPFSIFSALNSTELDLSATASALGLTGQSPKVDHSFLADEKEKRWLFLSIASAIGPLDLLSSPREDFPPQVTAFLASTAKCLISPLLRAFNLWTKSRLKIREVFLRKGKGICSLNLQKSSPFCHLLFPSEEMTKVRNNAERLNIPVEDILFPKETVSPFSRLAPRVDASHDYKERNTHWNVRNNQRSSQPQRGAQASGSSFDQFFRKRPASSQHPGASSSKRLRKGNNFEDKNQRSSRRRSPVHPRSGNPRKF